MDTPRQYAVWAPDADQVEVVCADRRPMVRHGRPGWWVAPMEPGDDGRYAFSLDGGEPRPDPRSLSQPDGVHAASALVDLAAHDWGDGAWTGHQLDGAVLYELHVGTFTAEGTFAAATERLDHLVDLGVTTITLMPVAAFPGRHGWGYDGVALFAVHEPYGGARGLQAFVDACHQRGLAVHLDVVYNHLGPSGNYLAQFGPYFTDRHHTPWGDAVNLDGPRSDEVRAFLLDNTRMWLTDFHLDGLRLDAVHALHDERAEHLLESLAALADEISEQTGIPRHLIAESDRNDPATVSPRGPGGAGGLGLAGQWADDIHHALHVALTGESQGYYADFADPGALGKVLTATPFFHDGTYSSFRGRVHGRPVDEATTPPWRFVASLQTHDQVGNRAAGDRLCHSLTPGQAAIGAALLLTAPYTPMLFMGEEWGASTPWQFFTDHSEPELVESIRTGRSREFAEHGWATQVPDPQDEGTVTASRLHWAEVSEPPHADLLVWHRTLIRLRRDLPDLAEGPLAGSSLIREGDLLLLTRGRVHVLANPAEEPAQLRLVGDPSGRRTAAEYGGVQVAEDTVQLPAHSVIVLVTDENAEPCVP
ncbi:malto-oligosyltrehalose trehalohydrolase [Ornithinimicrobium ciconiae]|uniref:Malto-oligosyltrehalose trehalohydrolase n=1 Tax=Ornithinimicrobium ciconiae TaxID=2594265 RepID=A0A516G7X0_9MICO|nr:malto-oligosyltrehalose trehalohydrolase [Ornithinimicrobium ciconiae]QDO87619.1 malto-oligosyltrehalose trehalohydrolase [Ornithinimicrobium ciconiae]